MDRLQTTTEELLKKMGVRYDTVEVGQEEDGVFYKILIKSQDSSILIGRDGEHLDALGNVLGKILTKEDRALRVLIDVNNYLTEQIERIRAKAKIFADRSKTFECDVELEPMSPHDRKIVHTLFENDPNIFTKSTGEGPSRRVVISYKKTQPDL